MTRKRSSLWRALAVTALFCAFVAPARADLHAGLEANLDAGLEANLQAGLDAYKRGDYVTTLKKIGPLAKRGNISAQYLLGVMLVEGRGVAKDPVMALAWLTCATAPRKGTAKDGDEVTNPDQPIGTNPDQPIGKAQKQVIMVRKQAIQLRNSVTKQLPEELSDKARRIAKGCETVAARAKEKEEELRNFYRFGLMERIFFFAGDTIIIGLMVIAGQSGLSGLQAVLNSLVNVFGNLLLGLISIVWWFFAGRIFFIIGNVVRRNTHERALKKTSDGVVNDDDERRRSELL